MKNWFTSLLQTKYCSLYLEGTMKEKIVEKLLALSNLNPPKKRMFIYYSPQDWGSWQEMKNGELIFRQTFDGEHTHDIFFEEETKYFSLSEKIDIAEKLSYNLYNEDLVFYAKPPHCRYFKTASRCR